MSAEPPVRDPDPTIDDPQLQDPPAGVPMPGYRERSAEAQLPPVDRSPLAARKRNRALLQVACILITLFMGIPIYLIALSALSNKAALNYFPKTFLPTNISFETISFFLGSTGVVPSFLNSVLVGVATMLLSLLVGAPAGYALARFTFRGKDPYQLFLLFTRALPIVVLSIPLATLFIQANISDTPLAVILLHTALALPTTVLITASIFVSVPKDVEEAALMFGCTPLGAFAKVVLPMALPGIAAASIFTFVLSWNEVLGATILTTQNRTLPAQVLTALPVSTPEFRFAGGFALIVPSMIFIFFMRRYLLNMWGSTIR